MTRTAASAPRSAVTRNGYRDAAKTDGHPRSAENIASLALGWHEFLAFGERIGAITDAERAAYWSRAWSALCAVGAEQESYAADSDPVGIYLGSVRALIASGRVHVAGRDGGCPAGKSRPLGMGRRHVGRRAHVAPAGRPGRLGGRR